MSSELGLVAGDGGAHVGVGVDVLIFDVVHDAEIAAAEGFRDGHGHASFGFNHFGAHLLGAGRHFLLAGDGGGAAHFGFGLGDLFVCFCLFGLEAGTDVVGDINIGDVDGKDFEGGAGVDSFLQNKTGDGIGILEDFFVGAGRTDGGDDAFSDSGNDGFLSGTTDEAFEVGADGDAGADVDRDSVFGHGGDFGNSGVGVGAFDDLGVDGGADRFEDRFAGVFGGEVDGAGTIEWERDACLVSGDEGENDVGDITAGEVVGFEVVGRYFDIGLGSGNAVVDDERGGDFAQLHEEEVEEADGRSGDAGLQPEVEEIDDEEEEDKSDEACGGEEDELEGAGSC